MKKVFYILLFLIVVSIPCYADTMAVQAITSISTEKPNESVKVRVMRDCTLDDIELKIGYVLDGKIMSVTKPKRLKRDAKFTFAPLEYVDDCGHTHHIPNLYIGTYSSKFEVDPKQIAKSAALSVGNHFVKGISTGFYAIEGAVENKEGNIIKSAAENVYENSPLSYIGKGQQLHIVPDTCFGLKFKQCKNAPKE